MKITKYLFILTALIAAGIQSVYAQSTDSEHKGLLWSSLHGLDYEFKAGVNIGGTSPLPLPQEIRSLDSYSPGLAITLEGSATKWIDVQKKWGVSIGFRLDKKDMTTDATVKNYGNQTNTCDFLERFIYRIVQSLSRRSTVFQRRKIIFTNVLLN